MDLSDKALNKLPFLNRSLRNEKGNTGQKKIEDQGIIRPQAAGSQS
jgi:hypothetical protein